MLNRIFFENKMVESGFIELNASYEFLVKKEVLIPGLEEQLIMIALDGTMHLMPSKPYEKYPLIIGQKVKCYIDKINCVGKVFLEPEHPYYKRGEVYEFDIKFISEKYYKRGKYRRKLFIKDYNGEMSEAIPHKFNYDFKVSEIQKCKVIRLKKGKVVITNRL